MKILGIETSCDETAIALIETRGEGAPTECKILASLIHSQADLHSKFGGVYPTLAKREHGKNLIPILEKALLKSSLPILRELTDKEYEERARDFQKDIAPQNPELYEAFMNAPFLKSVPNIDRIAVTEGPGLEPALWVGITLAGMLAKLWNIPVLPVNHMEGHVLGSLIDSNIQKGEWQKLKALPLPSLAFLISGGHTEFVSIEKIGSYKIIGQTKDDAVGEAFDKAARLLGLPYPGGPELSKMAEEAESAGLKSLVRLPRPMSNSGDLNFSFSGIKTAVLYALRDLEKEHGQVTIEMKKGLALEFETAVTETLSAKLRMALEQTGSASLVIGGGVSANQRLRKAFESIANEYGIELFLPTKHVSGDNALMIALSGALKPEPLSGSGLKARGTWKIDSK